jgi:hypothetical protein
LPEPLDQRPANTSKILSQAIVEAPTAQHRECRPLAIAADMVRAFSRIAENMIRVAGRLHKHGLLVPENIPGWTTRWTTLRPALRVIGGGSKSCHCVRYSAGGAAL